MTTPKSTTQGSFGERLRFLRGDETQEEFSERLNVSRASLANWETGRTQPRRKVLREVSLKLGVSETFLIKGEDEDVRDLANSLHCALVGPKDITADEAAILRILRVCSSTTVLRVVELLTNEVEREEDARRLIDPLTALDDIARLYSILERDGFYDRGITEQNLSQLIDELARKKRNK